jgi:arylsulfatase
MSFRASVVAAVVGAVAVLILASGTAMAAEAATPAGGEARRRPNIILILADDMGFSDAGCFGGEIHTPAIDRLAAEGTRLTQFYNVGRCCPTRAALLTGLYPHQAGVGHMIDDRGPDQPAYRGELNDRCVTLAEVLGAAGYRTAMAGKWHLVNATIEGKEQVNHQGGKPWWITKNNWPVQRGFQSFYGTILGVEDYFDPFTLTRGNEPIEAAPPKDFYYTDAITDEAVKQIEASGAGAGAGAEARPERPLFLYVAYTAPHWPLHALEVDIDKYEHAYDAGWERVRAARRKRQEDLGLVDPAWPMPAINKNVRPWEQVPEKERAWQARRMAVYAAQIDRMDQGIARILKALDERKMTDDTLVLFMSDNGGCDENVQRQWYDIPTKTRDGREIQIGNTPANGMPGAEETWQSYGPPWATVSNTPLRLYKHFAHEGGISSPFVARWPKHVPAGAVRKDVAAHVIDLMPTLADLAGATYPKEFRSRAIRPVEGVSLAAALTDAKTAPPSRDLYWEHEGNCAIRRGDLKLVRRKGQPWELYDLSRDRGETKDLSASEPARVEELSAAWERWADRVGVDGTPSP